MLNLKHLYYYHVFAQEMSTTKAATRLGISSPALSNQLKELESFLGFKLTKRLKGRVIVTELGEMVVHYADRMFSAYEELKTRIPTGSESGGSRFAVGICENIGARFGFDLLSLISKSQLSLAQSAFVSFRSADQLMTEFKAGSYDLVIGAFAIESGSNSPWVTQTLDFPVRLFAPLRLLEGVSTPLRQVLETNLDALIEHANARQISVIIPARPAILREETDRFFLNLKGFPTRTVECNNSSGIVELIEAGFAMGFVPTPSLLDFKSGKLLCVLGPPAGYWNHGISVVAQEGRRSYIAKVSPLADIFHIMK